VDLIFFMVHFTYFSGGYFVLLISLKLCRLSGERGEYSAIYFRGRGVLHLLYWVTVCNGPFSWQALILQDFASDPLDHSALPHLLNLLLHAL